MVLYAIEKFQPYLLLSKVIICNHSTLKHLDNVDSKLQLIRWVLLLQEFALERRDKKGTENVAADHLSQLPTYLSNEGECDLPINNSFPDDYLFALAIQTSLVHGLCQLFGLWNYEVAY